LGGDEVAKPVVVLGRAGMLRTGRLDFGCGDGLDAVVADDLKAGVAVEGDGRVGEHEEFPGGPVLADDGNRG
jgi:hypothetical protein